MDEDGNFTEVAGPELQNLPVMTEGTDKGTVEFCEHKTGAEGGVVTVPSFGPC